MSNGNLLQEARSMVESGKITTAQAIPLILAMVADMYEIVKDVPAKDDYEKLEKRQDESEDDIQALQLSDKRWGALNVLVASIITGIGVFFGKSQ